MRYGASSRPHPPWRADRLCHLHAASQHSGQQSLLAGEGQPAVGQSVAQAIHGSRQAGRVRSSSKPMARLRQITPESEVLVTLAFENRIGNKLWKACLHASEECLDDGQQ
jgi:hypothetical protein